MSSRPDAASAAGPVPGGDPRGDQADDDGEHDREHCLERDARPARHQRRNEHDRRPQDEQCDQERPDGPEPVRERLEEAQRANARTARRAAPRRCPPARAQTRPDRRCPSPVAREPDRAAQRRTGGPLGACASRNALVQGFPGGGFTRAGEAPATAERQMSGRTTCETLLIRSARSSSNSLATAWIVAAIGIASSAPIRPAPPRRRARRPAR